VTGCGPPNRGWSTQSGVTAPLCLSFTGAAPLTETVVRSSRSLVGKLGRPCLGSFIVQPDRRTVKTSSHAPPELYRETAIQRVTDAQFRPFGLIPRSRAGLPCLQRTTFYSKKIEMVTPNSRP
jgi:hypothetical protein